VKWLEAEIEEAGRMIAKRVAAERSVVSAKSCVS
jgi:hypothetical protein